MNVRGLLLLMLVAGHLVGQAVWGPEGCAEPRKARAPASCLWGEPVDGSATMASIPKHGGGGLASQRCLEPC